MWRRRFRPNRGVDLEEPEDISVEKPFLFAAGCVVQIGKPRS